MPKKLTVGIPVYNEDRYLLDTLRSLQAQTIKDVEFVIADNASTDGSLQIAKNFVEKDNRFRLIEHSKNLGAIGNLACLLEASAGTYFMFMGAHDLISPNYLINAIAILEMCPDVAMVAGYPESMSETGDHQGLVERAIYDFSNDNALIRYLNSVVQLFDCTCFHSVSRRSDWIGLDIQKTISFDHVWISRLLWHGKLRYMENERFIRRNFEARPMPIETAILGNDGKLFRNDFYNYYIEDFDKLFNGSVQIRSFLHHKILTVLESRFGTAGLALNDGLIG